MLWQVLMHDSYAEGGRQHSVLRKFDLSVANATIPVATWPVEGGRFIMLGKRDELRIYVSSEARIVEHDTSTGEVLHVWADNEHLHLEGTQSATRQFAHFAVGNTQSDGLGEEVLFAYTRIGNKHSITRIQRSHRMTDLVSHASSARRLHNPSAVDF